MPNHTFPILSFFAYEHLPVKLQEVSKLFHDLAVDLAARQHDNPAEMAAGLRKLLEAKDCAVRALL